MLVKRLTLEKFEGKKEIIINKIKEAGITDIYLTAVIVDNYDESFSSVEFESGNFMYVYNECLDTGRKCHPDRGAIQNMANYICGETDEIDIQESVGRILLEELPLNCSKMIVSKLSNYIVDKTYDNVILCIDTLINFLDFMSGRTLTTVKWTVKTVGF